MAMINMKINDKEYSFPDSYKVIDAARDAGIRIPTLCYLKDLNEIGSCRMCLVEVKGARALQAACVYPVSEGLEIYTNSPRVKAARKATLELILSNHEKKCLTCVRSQNCELQQLAKELGVEELPYEGENIHYELDNTSTSIVRDNNKCILCRRCVAACDNQAISVIKPADRGFNAHISTAFEMPIKDVGCIFCGQCIVSCPVGALRERNDIPKVVDAIDNPEKHVVVQTAPAVRAALGEEFGLPIGTPVTGKMVAALRRLGFDKVFDTDTAADVTIMEEGTEFIERFKSGENLPIITSCSPGWVKFCEHYYPEFIPNLSSCKSPMEMFGAIIKSYYAEKAEIDKENIFSVAIMPCTSKKFEAARDEHKREGAPDIDVSLTTRELAQMIKAAGIDFNSLPDEEFDQPFGEATGAGVIFGTTGGVMEAALRTVYEILEGKPLENLNIEPVRGLEGIKEATISVADKDVKVAVVHGTANARKILDKVKSGEHYDFIEIMACPGGCIHGGGQPIVDAATKAKVDVKALRAKALYSEDEASTLRKSHENPYVQKLYKEFFGEPGSHKAHELLHTTYQKRYNH